MTSALDGGRNEPQSLVEGAVGGSDCGKAGGVGREGRAGVDATAAMQPESMCSLIDESGTMRPHIGQSANLEPVPVVVSGSDDDVRLAADGGAVSDGSGRFRNRSIRRR